MNKYDYSYTDLVISVLRKDALRLFENFKLASFDELNVLQAAIELYNKLYDDMKRKFLLLMKNTCLKVGGEEDDLDEQFLLAFLAEYNPITEYKFLNEVDRKRARFEESLISKESLDPANKALRLWSNMVSEYAVEFTDRVALEEYKRYGVNYLQWITNIDGKECEVCRDRHKKIYRVREFPGKPHIGCRCKGVPVK